MFSIRRNLHGSLVDSRKCSTKDTPRKRVRSQCRCSIQRVAFNKEREYACVTPDDAATNQAGEDDGNDPMYERVCCEAECK